MAAKIIEVAAGLVFRGGRVLITQRLSQAHLGGLWEFPGGKREPDETFEECLRRELKEELAIEVTVGELLESVTHAYPHKTVLLNFYQCRLTGGEPQPIECADVAWIGPDELQAYRFPPADERLLERLRQTPQLWL